VPHPDARRTGCRGCGTLCWGLFDASTQMPRMGKADVLRDPCYKTGNGLLGAEARLRSCPERSAHSAGRTTSPPSKRRRRKDFPPCQAAFSVLAQASSATSTLRTAETQ